MCVYIYVWHLQALKVRGKAHRFLGNWEEAAKDLSSGLNIDFDEGTQELLKHVQTYSTKITAKKNKERNKAIEKERKEKFAKAKAAAAGIKIILLCVWLYASVVL